MKKERKSRKSAPIRQWYWRDGLEALASTLITIGFIYTLFYVFN